MMEIARTTMGDKVPTQAERILAYLMTGQRLTQFEALTELGIMRLASRITDLCQAGHDIERQMVEVRNRWGESCHVAAYTLKTTNRTGIAA